MREVISSLMLALDEVWLTHADCIRLNSTVTAGDVQLEAALFAVEAQLAAAHAALPKLTSGRVALGRAPALDCPDDIPLIAPTVSL